MKAPQTVRPIMDASETSDSSDQEGTDVETPPTAPDGGVDLDAAEEATLEVLAGPDLRTDLSLGEDTVAFNANLPEEDVSRALEDLAEKGLASSVKVSKATRWHATKSGAQQVSG
jgi:hypothetical protein